MFKKIIIFSTLIMTMSLPMAANSIDQTQPVTISVAESSVNVQNAAGEMLEIYNLTGVRIAQIRIDSPEKTINLNIPKGYYIFKIGKHVRKIAIK